MMSKLNGTARLLGDSGYAIAPWMLTPFRNTQTADKETYNKQHSKERVIIERVFGQVKKRFPLLGNLIRVKLDKVPKIFVACAILHNFGKQANDVYEIGLPLEDDGDEFIENGINEVPDAEIRRRGQQKRNEVMRVLLQELH
jgi:hypothetical protein